MKRIKYCKCEVSRKLLDGSFCVDCNRPCLKRNKSPFINIRLDNRPNINGLWLKGIEIEFGNIGLRIQFYNLIKY